MVTNITQKSNLSPELLKVSAMKEDVKNVAGKENPGYLSSGTTEINARPEKEKMHYNINDLIERRAKEPEIPFIWSGIKRGSFGYVFGPPKSGKTIICENLGISIALNKTNFLGIEIKSSGQVKVLFISMEEYWKNRTERNEKQIKALGLTESDHLNYFVVDEHFPRHLNTDQAWQKFKKVIIDSGADIIFVDSMTRIFPGEIEDSSKCRDISIKLREIANGLGITLILIHHAPKLKGNPLSVDDLAGSRIIAQEADFILGINKLVDGTHYFKEVSCRYKQEKEQVITFKINNNLWLDKIAETEEFNLIIDRRENPENEVFVLDTIKELITPEDDNKIQTRRISDELNGTITRSEVFRYLNRLESKGFIDRSERGFVKLK